MDTPENEQQQPTTTVGQDSVNEQIQALQQQLTDAEARAAAARDAQLRAMADLDNIRKRSEREMQNSRKFGQEKVLSDLLGVCDSLELGLKAAGEGADAKMIEGMELTLKQLLSVLEKHGVSVIEPVGQPFNPDHHEAMGMVPSNEMPPNHVVSVMQKGYLLHERLLRPAMVMVSRAG